MRTHVLKLQKYFCDAVYNGDKTFELRYNDRGFQKGDRVRFDAIDGDGMIDHPINDEEYEITYVLAGWGLQRNFVAFGIRNAWEPEPAKEMTTEQLSQTAKELLGMSN